MILRFFIFSVILVLSTIQRSTAQGFEAPSDSNAVVYFILMPKYRNTNLYNFFHESKFIGKFEGPNYIRYECPKGPNIFWVLKENKYFLDCDLKAGGTYIVQVSVSVGAFINFMAVTPITDQSKDFNYIVYFIQENESLKMSQEKIDSWQKEYEERGIITRSLKKI